MRNPEKIYLQPECCVVTGEGRHWCENDIFECPEGEDGVAYIRADIVKHLLSFAYLEPRMEGSFFYFRGRSKEQSEAIQKVWELFK